METESEPVTTKKLAKHRWKGNSWLFIAAIVLIVASRYINDAVALTSGRDPAQIADLGPEMIQVILIGGMHIASGMLISITIALLVEKQLRPDSFNGWSRFGILVGLLFWGYCQVVSGLL